MKIRGAGDCIREYVENDGCCITFDNIAPSPAMPYGLVGTMLGHRYPKNPVVTKIPITPMIDVGANAANDDKRHKGKMTLAVISKIDACRDCKMLDIEKDDDATILGALPLQNPTIPRIKLLHISPKVKL